MRTDIRGAHCRFLFLPLTFLKRADKTAQSYSDGSEVRDLVDLYLGIQLPARFKDRAHLVGRDGVDPAAEGDKLDKLGIGMLRGIKRGAVQPGVICPLIEDTKSPSFLFIM